MNERRPLTLAEIDTTIRGLDMLGIGAACDGCGETWAWQQDRPMLPSELQSLLDQAQHGTVSPDLVRDMTQQLRQQAQAFAQCADALSANDASKITMPTGNGLGIAEVRELLDGDLRMTALPQGQATLEQHAASRGELAGLFRIASAHCARAADAADAFRLGKWRAAYERVILSAVSTAARGGAV